MKDAATLLALADTVEALTGPDREVDGAIDRIFHQRPKHGDFDASELASWQVRDGFSGLLVRMDGFARDSFCAREYTASLDAAMALVPVGYEFALGTGRREHITEDGRRPWAWCATGSDLVDRLPLAATPALALTAAALRAHAAIATGEG